MTKWKFKFFVYRCNSCKKSWEYAFTSRPECYTRDLEEVAIFDNDKVETLYTNDKIW